MPDSNRTDSDCTTIRRAPRRRRYTVVDNATVEDDALSFKALGLLVYLLSKPDDWQVNRDHLASTHTDGVAAVRSALAELEQAGYIVREQGRRDDGTGRWAPGVCVVHERPADPAGRFPASGFPASGKSPTTKEGDKPKTDDQSAREPSPSADPSLEPIGSSSVVEILRCYAAAVADRADPVNPAAYRSAVLAGARAERTDDVRDLQRRHPEWTIEAAVAALMFATGLADEPTPGPVIPDEPEGTVTCPACRGDRLVLAPDGSGYEQCRTCSATGRVDPGSVEAWTANESEPDSATPEASSNPLRLIQGTTPTDARPAEPRRDHPSSKPGPRTETTDDP